MGFICITKLFKNKKMNISFSNSNELLQNAIDINLYKELVEQLNKDFLLASIDESFTINMSPIILKNSLHEIIYKLINEKFSEYLSLLYIVDVSEEAVKAIDGSDTLKLSECIVFLILRREWQKIWFKKQYS